MKKILTILFFIVFTFTNVFAISNNNQKVLILASINKNSKNVDNKIKYTIFNLLENVKNKNNLMIKLYKNKYYIILYKTKDFQEYKNLIKKYRAISIQKHKKLKNYLLLKISKKNLSKIKLTQNFVDNLYLGLKEKFGEKNANKMLNNYLNCYKNLKIIKKNFLVVNKNCNFIFPLKTENGFVAINFKKNVIKISPYFIETFLNQNKIKTTKKTFKQILINHQLKKTTKVGKQEKNKNVVKLDQNPFFTTKKMVKNKTIKIKKSKMPVNMGLQKEINVSMLKQLVSEYNPANKEHNLTSVINLQNKENHSFIDIIHKQLNNKKEITAKILKQSKETKLSLKQKDNNNTKISNTSTNIVVKKSKTIKNTTIPNNSNETKDNNSNIFLYIIAVLVLIVIAYFVGIYYKRKKKNKYNNVVENKKTEEKNSNKKVEYTDNKDNNKEIKYISNEDVEVEKINENKEIKAENLKKEQEDGKNSEDNENNKTITTSTELITFFAEKKEQLEEIIIKAGKYTYIKKLKNFEKLKKEKQ